MKRIILYADRYMRSKDFCIALILLLFGVSVAHSQENINNSIKDIATDTIIEKKRMSSIEIHFRLDKYYLDLQYMGNQESLNRFSHQIDSIGISNIDSVVIVSQSSPEGVYEHNLWLSDNRAKTMRKYITETHPEIAPILTVNPDGESWAQLRNYVENDTLMGDEIIRKVLAVIDSDVDIETKKLRMQQLPVYSYLLRTYYPRIRNSMFCILYHHIITSESEPVEIAVQPEPEPVAELVPVVKDTLKVDTIQVPESEWIPKLYLKTNAIGLALAMANVAIEVDFARHWSFNLPIYYSAWDYFKSTVKFRTLAIQPEFRYWFAEENDGFFTGAHFGLAYYNFAFDGDYRYQDHNRETPSIGGGVSMGYRLPISKNNRWRVEFSLGAGVYSRHYDKFHNTPRTKDGLIIEDIKKTYWGIDQAAVSFSYSFDLKKKGGIR